MKLFKLLTIVLVTFIFNSCDTKDLADITINTNFTEKIQLGAPIGVEEPLNKSEDLELSNDEINEYVDKIKEIKINKITYKFIEFTGISGNDPDSNCSFSDVKIKADGNLFETNAYVIKETIDNGVVFTITDEEDLNTMAASFLADNKVTFNMTGNSTSTAITAFKMEITFDLTIIASPLN